MLRITPKQARKVRRLARDQCCNCVDGTCLLLDDGDSH
ncbi:MAG: cysteine-rich VLP protein, partial [Clostridia bacterium]|nr:cysteine-rich VLP protein [Clostridia bacterium]